MRIAELVGFRCARGGTDDPVGVERRPSRRNERSHAVEDAHRAGSVGRRCRHGVALRRVACPSIGGKTWRTHEREREPLAPVAIVTGASSGIGEATAHCLAKAGYAVVVAARRAKLLDQLVADIRAQGGTALSAPTDLSDAEETSALVKTSARCVRPGRRPGQQRRIRAALCARANGSSGHAPCL